MDRMVLRDDQWERIARLVPGKVGDPGRSGADNRLFVEAVLWIVRVGAPWRDLPKAFGKWNSVFQRFRRWVKAGVFDRIFEALSDDAICLAHSLVALPSTAGVKWQTTGMRDEMELAVGNCRDA